MMKNRSLYLLLCIPLLLSACASAGKRLEQGKELEMQGRYDEAVYRYVDALKKDASMAEARSRLIQAGEAAIEAHLYEADAWAQRGDIVSSAREYQVIDALMAQAQTVGVRLPVSSDYPDQRRRVFDEAIAQLLEAGASAHERGRWQEGLVAYRQARQEFEPTVAQRDEALTGESAILLSWSQAELDAGHLRSAYDWAAAVHELEWVPAEYDLEATTVMEEALALGEVEIMALPVTAGPDYVDGDLIDLEVRVNELLHENYWQYPPPFIRLSDPMDVREVVRQAEVLDAQIRAPVLGLLLRLVDAEYGAWLELIDVESTEFEVKKTVRNVTTHSGRAVSFTIEEGQMRLTSQARVIVVDRNASEVTNLIVTASGTGPFRRGVYAGDPASLNLGRRDVDLFDQMEQEAQRQAIRHALAIDLSNQLAPVVIEPVLARVP